MSFNFAAIDLPTSIVIVQTSSPHRAEVVNIAGAGSYPALVASSAALPKPAARASWVPVGTNADLGDMSQVVDFPIENIGRGERI
ncbi:MAG: hypothetical protein QGH73_04130 [Rhodospirillales bacterium]|nr:hypothetical protein [Rhodospirillales bacterium]MDP6643700.1 hypothetical protein [Rhodospirillales bacterium]MDP6840844.1 hypothetical protein [Rhodospirillales bacterium]